MSGPPPIAVFWDGEHFAPAGPHWASLARKNFAAGEVHQIEVREERSQRSHSHYFASINEAWQNLPETVGERFQTSEHLRKYALIRAGYCDERSIVCASKAEAQRVAAFVKPMDDYAVVAATGAVVVVYTAKSQSVRAMGKEEFQKSKDAVLTIIAGLIGTTTEVLTQAGEAA